MVDAGACPCGTGLSGCTMNFSPFSPPLPLPLSGEGAFFVLPGFRAGAKKAATARFSYVNKM